MPAIIATNDFLTRLPGLSCSLNCTDSDSINLEIDGTAANTAVSLCVPAGNLCLDL